MIIRRACRPGASRVICRALSTTPISSSSAAASSSTSSTTTNAPSVPPTRSSTPATTSPTVAQPFTTPQPMPPLVPKSAAAPGAGVPGAPPALPVSACPAGTVLRGLNYLKGREDPVALAEAEYPAWLWTCLEKKGAELDAGEQTGGDEYAKSAKERKKATKARKALEARQRLGLEAQPEVKIPLQQQSIDLPAEGSAAFEARGDLTLAMRRERRKTIKEVNYLKTL